MKRFFGPSGCTAFMTCLIWVIVFSAKAAFGETAFVRMQVGENGFDILPPAEKCLYKKFSTLEGDPSIAYFGACSRARPSGLFTVSIGTAEKFQNAAKLKEFFTSDSGRAALAQSRTSDGIQINEYRQKAGILFLRTEDKQGALAPLTDRSVWRAMFQQNGHFISITYLALASNQLTSDQSFDRIQDFAIKLKRQNIRWIPAGLKKRQD